ncbi:phenylpyruvate tautomerase PptA (4-oxalocrotonate tautomerase family) [Nitrospirillum amazonense]|uniref:Phenylpyruvate tautomerase PptA (4-oxalocrotonate tautomerase family) n=1 Tax=Nitrospirillum amazonense TaxID=28077 RepID=A0A560EL76_9PROT|nr:tautomerase family protein [Nitrospirillum amazonense]TWB10087.1 phenylpyruvate tautomerase PptA (4-oxalocrotonate tautomerase family) [Nitrospirillum amazonense]
MPMWQIYHPENAFTDADKQELAQKITGIYESFLPRFYVNVFFHTVPKMNLYIGGEPAGDFVRVVIEHIARSITDPEQQRQFLKGCARVLEPYVSGRGYRWELHVDDTPFELWTINGFKPPLPNTPAEIQWRTENKPSAYEQA